MNANMGSPPDSASLPGRRRARLTWLAALLAVALLLLVPDTGGAQTANTPATGAPTISGTAQVGQTLTAATSGIMDTDGLTSPGYTYQW